jgi:hypothetical protein
MPSAVGAVVPAVPNRLTTSDPAHQRQGGLDSLASARGMLSQRDVPDLSAFERANYPETLAPYARPAGP